MYSHSSVRLSIFDQAITSSIFPFLSLYSVDGIFFLQTRIECKRHNNNDSNQSCFNKPYSFFLSHGAKRSKANCNSLWLNVVFLSFNFFVRQSTPNERNKQMIDISLDDIFFNQSGKCLCSLYKDRLRALPYIFGFVFFLFFFCRFCRISHLGNRAIGTENPNCDHCFVNVRTKSCFGIFSSRNLTFVFVSFSTNIRCHVKIHSHGGGFHHRRR